MGIISGRDRLILILALAAASGGLRPPPAGAGPVVRVVPHTAQPGAAVPAAVGAGLGPAAPAGAVRVTLGSLSPTLALPAPIAPAGPFRFPPSPGRMGSPGAAGSVSALPTLVPPAPSAVTPAARVAPVAAARLAPARAKTAGPSKAGAINRAKGLLSGTDFSAFSPARLSRMPVSGAHSAGRRLMDLLLGRRSVVGSGSEVAGRSAAAASPKRKAASLRRPQKSEDYDPLDRPFSPYRLSMFEWDPEQYALTFLFGVEDTSAKGYELLVGLAVHDAMEHLYRRVSEGRPAESITVRDVLAEYEASWRREKKAGRYRTRDGWTAADYKRRGRSFIRQRFEALFPFDGHGKVLALEERVLWTMTDPATGKEYDFKGKIDRLMTMKGDTIYIRDWKTHFNPPSQRDLQKDYQLGLYALGLKKAYPDLVRGKKIKLVWDFKEFSQEIEADEEYLAGIEKRVLELLRAIETFKARVEAERPEWEKRLRPDRRPRGLKKAKESADRLGAIDAELKDKKAESRKLSKEYDRLEEGVARYAKEQGLDVVPGKSHVAAVERKSGRGVPTKSDDPEAHEAVIQVLRKGEVWEKYSSLDPHAVRRKAEVQGGEDHAVFQRFSGDLRSGHAHSLTVEKNEDAEEGSGGVARTRLPKKAWAPEAESGLLSATQLSLFLADRDEFVKRYIFRMRDEGPKPMGYLAGSAIHETMEQLFVWIKGGKLIRHIRLTDVLKVFEERWKELRDEADYRPEDGLTAADYKRGSKAYIRAKWKQMYPFDDQGRAVYLERRMHFTLTDPETGKTYKFQGIPDRVMIQDGVIVIRDWKSHYKPPSDEEVRQKDYQLGLYVLALRQLYPDLMRGRHARLIWDFKNKATVIEADDAYVADLEKRLFKILREMDALKADVEAHRDSWEDRLRPVDVPGSTAEAAKRVDRMGVLATRMAELDAEAKALKAEAGKLKAGVIDFARRTGRPRIEGKTHTAQLRKKGAISVPTKGRQRKAYDNIVKILKQAGVWEKYSKLDYRALKKAMADPKHPDRAVLKKIEPHLREFRSVKVTLSELGAS